MILEKIQQNQITYGTWITMAYPEVTEILSNLPFDWFVFDMEHAPLSVKDIEFLLMPLKNRNIVPLARVPWNDFVIIKRVLDIGIQGIIIPWVNNKIEAENAVKATRYYPDGIRGIGPRRCIMYGFDDIKEYYQRANKETLVIAQIETMEGVKNLYEILSVKGLSGVFIGPNDLSLSLGCFRDFKNPKYIQIIELICKTARSMNKIAGIMTRDPEDALDKAKKGFNFIALAHDTYYMVRGFQEAFKLLGILK
jgi:2-keto-3-deoxy-L-rhamnonate aldolase RhmA